MPVSIFVSVLKYLTLDKLISLSGGMINTFVLPVNDGILTTN